MSEPTPPPSFEAALTELEQVLRDLEDGSMTLDASLSRYEQGVGLLRACYERLQQAEQKIQLLTGLDENGQPVFQPFAHASSQAKPSAKKS
ncbi:MAG: exodeoxyribonuclease VII small subunit [Gemmataceae bacterium]